MTAKQLLDNYESVVKLDVSAFGMEMSHDIRQLRKHLPEGAKVLDVGCGFGMPTAQAAHFFKMSACDLPLHEHRDFIEILMRMRNIEFKWIEGNALPYPDASFDGVLLYAVIEHVVDKEALLKECARLLKPGGKVFAFRAVNRRAFAEWVARTLGMPTHGEEVVTEPMLRTALENSGFRMDALGYQGWFPENSLPRWPVYLANWALTHLPFVKAFSHDFWVIATKVL